MKLHRGACEASQGDAIHISKTSTVYPVSHRAFLLTVSQTRKSECPALHAETRSNEQVRTEPCALDSVYMYHLKTTYAFQLKPVRQAICPKKTTNLIRFIRCEPVQPTTPQNNQPNSVHTVRTGSSRLEPARTGSNQCEPETTNLIRFIRLRAGAVRLELAWASSSRF